MTAELNWLVYGRYTKPEMEEKTHKQLTQKREDYLTHLRSIQRI